MELHDLLKLFASITATTLANLLRDWWTRRRWSNGGHAP